jgi:[ribosomal protein S18]-alanine N-acetyltransferase
MHLWPAKISDLASIVAIEKNAFSQPWSEATFLEELGRNPASLYVLKKNHSGPILGYLCYWAAAEEIQLLTVAVHPDHRRRGLGRFMMESLLQEARLRAAENIYLEVRPSNQPAINLYSQLGFQTLYRRPGYYQPGNEDALIMQKEV